MNEENGLTWRLDRRLLLENGIFTALFLGVGLMVLDLWDPERPQLALAAAGVISFVATVWIDQMLRRSQVRNGNLENRRYLDNGRRQAAIPLSEIVSVDLVTNLIGGRRISLTMRSGWHKELDAPRDGIVFRDDRIPAVVNRLRDLLSRP